jgi:hypothetical protein
MRARPLRVLFVSHNLNAGEGAPTSLMQTVVGLRDSYGLEPVVYGLKPGEMAQAYETHGIKVIVPDFATRSRLAGNVLSRAYPKAAAMFRDLLERERIDEYIQSLFRTETSRRHHQPIIRLEPQHVPDVDTPR